MNRIKLKTHSIVQFLTVAATLLVIVSVAGQIFVYMTGHDHVYGLIELVNIDSEKNIPTIFSVFLMFFASFLLFIITILEKKRVSSDYVYWVVMSVMFLLMAFDEGAEMHDIINQPLRELLGGENLGIFYFPWVLPAAILILILTAFFLKFLLRLPRNIKFGFIIAAVLYIGGALGIELIGGYYIEQFGKNNLTYSLIVTFEECGELAGLIIFIRTLLVYITQNFEEITFHFDAKGVSNNS